MGRWVRGERVDGLTLTPHSLRMVFPYDPARRRTIALFAAIMAMQVTWPVLGKDKPEREGFWIGDWQILRGALESIEATRNPATGMPAIVVVFTPAGARHLATITEHAIGRTLPLSLDGVILMSPVVLQAITGGKMLIEAGSEDINTIAARMREAVGLAGAGGG